MSNWGEEGGMTEREWEKKRDKKGGMGREEKKRFQNVT